MRFVPCVVVALLAGGCVTTSKYNSKIAELDQLRAEQAKTASQREKDLRAQLDKTKAELVELEKQLLDVKAQLVAVTSERDAARKQLDDATALANALKQRLEKLGQNVDKLTSEKGQLAETLADAKARLEELRKQKAAAEARAQVFRDLIARLRSMIDSGQLKVVIRDGRMLIALPNDVLFDSGKTAIKKDGQAALARVAQVLAGIADRKFLVAGHTDDVPSTARAVEVTRFLVQSGLRPQVLAAAGYGEFDPVVANDSADHRAQNRRIEIVLQPNLSDLPSLDELKAPTK